MEVRKPASTDLAAQSVAGLSDSPSSGGGSKLWRQQQALEVVASLEEAELPDRETEHTITTHGYENWRLLLPIDAYIDLGLNLGKKTIHCLGLGFWVIASEWPRSREPTKFSKGNPLFTSGENAFKIGDPTTKSSGVDHVRRE
jgi:hypothetical protein